MSDPVPHACVCITLPVCWLANLTDTKIYQCTDAADAGIISVLIAVASSAACMNTFRQRAMRLRNLVETHFDPAHGWPKDPDVLNEEDVFLITGGKRSWKLEYAFLQKLPSFVGLFVGNMVMAFFIHWVVWMLVLYVAFSKVFPSNLLKIFLALTPIIFESMLKNLLFDKIVSKDHGIIQPRLYAAMDVLLSLTSTYTGPIKTIFRLVGGTICMFFHLLRHADDGLAALALGNIYIYIRWYRNLSEILYNEISDYLKIQISNL